MFKTPFKERAISHIDHFLKLRSSRAESNWQLRATVGQSSSSVQMASAYHVGAAVLVHVGRSGQLDAAHR